MHEKLQIGCRIQLLYKCVGVERAGVIRLQHEAFPHSEQLYIVCVLVVQRRIPTLYLVQAGIIQRACELGVRRLDGSHLIAEAYL